MVLVGRKSPYSLYNQTLSSFEDDGGAYDQADAAGFIKLQVRYLANIPMFESDALPQPRMNLSVVYQLDKRGLQDLGAFPLVSI